MYTEINLNGGIIANHCGVSESFPHASAATIIVDYDSTMRTIPTKSAVGEPVWEIAELFPQQGDWTEEGYLSLDTNLRVEFDDGVIQVLPTPKNPSDHHRYAAEGNRNIYRKEEARRHRSTGGI